MPPALAIFHETTIAAILSYFPDCDDAAQFLRLINTWWTISNSKARYNINNKLGNAAIEGDRKHEFLRAFADWLVSWKSQRLPRCEKFQLTPQTNEALVQTLRCHASLIEDLLREDKFSFVLTSRFQSDPLERRFGQYRQMSGGRFLVSLREVLCSENILKMKSILKENLQVSEVLKDDSTYSETDLKQIEGRMREITVEDANLNQQSREVCVYVSGYVAKKVKIHLENCCEQMLMGNCEDQDYTNILSRGGLIKPSESLNDYVAASFATLDAAWDIIKESQMPARIAAEHILSKSELASGFCCDKHEELVCKKIIRVICNIFLNSERKRKNESVIDDKVKTFKKLKRDK